MGNTRPRLGRLRARLRREKLDALIVTNVHNVRYLSGFTGEDSALLVGPRECLLVTDSRFTEAAEKETGPNGIAVFERKKSLAESLGKLVKKWGAKGVGFEGASMTFDFHRRLSGFLKPGMLRPTERWVEGLRVVKDAAEIRAIRRAIAAAEEAMQAALPAIRPGTSEMDVAAELDHQMRKRGAQASAFPTIAAAGERASLPHACPTRRKLKAGEALLLDWGARLEFYNSDLTRVLFLGTIPRSWQERYDAVLGAQQAALRQVRPGAKAKTVDRAARNSLRKKRLAKRFGHGIGHGVGLEVHEDPGLNSRSEARLQAGMVATVEPGVYFPGWGGIRIEDMVLVTPGGKEILTRFDKDASRMVI